MKASYMNHMGDDLMVCNSARVSFAKESKWAQQYHITNTADDRLHSVLEKEDMKLIYFLARNNHWTPFAHPQISLRVAAPVPIRTQCFKHKQGFVENEESRRYIKATPEVYFPIEWRMAAENVKQGSAGVHPDNKMIKFRYKFAVQTAIYEYEQMIKEGVCPEQARFILPQGCLVNWVWTGSLAAFARFYKQRTDPHAQVEVQLLAIQIGNIIQPLFPVSWAALTKDWNVKQEENKEG